MSGCNSGGIVRLNSVPNYSYNAVLDSSTARIMRIRRIRRSASVDQHRWADKHIFTINDLIPFNCVDTPLQCQLHSGN